MNGGKLRLICRLFMFASRGLLLLLEEMEAAN